MFEISCDPSWAGFLCQKEISRMLELIYRQIGDDYYPREKDIFRFMHMDIGSIRYVIVGMDPYASDYRDGNDIITPVATGRSFEVANVHSWSEKFKQSSLRNILKTVYYNHTGRLTSLEFIRNEIANGRFNISAPKLWFDNTEHQGVLWLNASLTVSPGIPGSHEYIWEDFMNHLIRHIILESPDIKFALFGNSAQERFDAVRDRAICCVHPRLSEFVSENCFSKMPGVSWVC